jgi:hypothetical protein
MRDSGTTYRQRLGQRRHARGQTPGMSVRDVGTSALPAASKGSVRLVLVAATLLALAVCPQALGELAVGSRSASDGWTVQVSVDPAEVGPIAVSVGRIRPAPVNGSQAWLQHDLVFENNSDRSVTFADTRNGMFLGPRARGVLLAADQGCGYGIYKRRIELACLLYLDIPTLEPHTSLTRTLTLWKGLPGMNPLRPGTYVFRHPIRFRIGREPPADGSGQTAMLEIDYRVAAGA